MVAGEDDDDCPICYEKMSERCILPSCMHTFCKSCILMVLSKDTSLSCAMCRQDCNIFEIKLSSGGMLAYKPTSVVGSIYIQGETEGLASYHFPSMDSCYISYESPRCMVWPKLDDATRPPPKKFFQNASFDMETRTFKGDIVWSPTSWNGDALWCYTMVFSEDFGTIESGQVEAFDSVERSTVNEVHKFGEHLVYFRKFVIL